MPRAPLDMLEAVPQGTERESRTKAGTIAGERSTLWALAETYCTEYQIQSLLPFHALLLVCTICDRVEEERSGKAADQPAHQPCRFSSMYINFITVTVAVNQKTH